MSPFGFILVVLLSTPPYAPDRLLVKFTDTQKEIIKTSLEERWINGALGYFVRDEEKSSVIDRRYITYIRRLILGRTGLDFDKSELSKWYVVGIDTTITSVEHAFKDLSDFPNISNVEFDYIYPVKLIPNDPLLFDDYYSGEWFPFKIDAIKAWDYTTGDTSVVVGGVDSGVFFRHPDIIDNLAINPGEDLNHNGRFDDSDVNGSDDDGDGYVDNIIGWDFMSNDWDPTPDGSEGSDHGTHVFGIASASTNNGIGIAGLGWHAKGLAFRCGTGTSIYLGAAVNAIYYAADRGAKVINFSWGGYSYNSSVADAVNYAFSHDVLMTGAAGNETTGVAIYPARYDHVIGVGATDYNDRKTDFSNYGPGVDIMAPGAMILSTVPDSGYDSWFGTSMAAPVVMGVGALIRSYKPELSAAEVESVLIWSADPIDYVNPDSLWGKLGAGRVNIYRAIAMLTYSNISIIDDSIADGNDGRPSYGENVTFYPILKNKEHWQNATSISLVMDSVTPHGVIQVIDSNASLSSLAAGEEKVVDDGFSFTVIDTHSVYVNFYMRIRSTPDNFVDTISYSLLINYPYVLLVDDNHYNERFKNFAYYYEKALRELNVGYEKLNTPLSHTLKFDSIKYVIWFTANDSTELLTDAEKDSLIAFMNSGGSVILSSQYYAEHDTTFISQYFGAHIASTGISQRYIKSDTGAVNSGIIDSLFFRITGGGGADNDYSIDALVAGDNSEGLMHFVVPTGAGNYGEAAVLHDGGNYKSIFLPWPIEAIDDAAVNKNTRAEVLKNLLNALGMNISGISEHNFSKYNNKEFLGYKKGFYTIITHSSNGIHLPALNEDVVFEVYNISGEKIRTVVALNGHMKFNSPLKNGVYFAFPQNSKCPKLRIVVIK